MIHRTRPGTGQTPRGASIARLVAVHALTGSDLSHQRWSTCLNEHLVVQRVRQDRISCEARTNADPVHLVRLLAVSDGTAMRCSSAAHPARTRDVGRR